MFINEELVAIAKEANKVKKVYAGWKPPYNVRKLKKLFKKLGVKLIVTNNDLKNRADGIIDGETLTLQPLDSSSSSRIIFDALKLLGYYIMYPEQKFIFFHSRKMAYMNNTVGLFSLFVLFSEKEFDEFVEKHTGNNREYSPKEIEKALGLSLYYFYKLLRLYDYQY